jgi:hypothetical protein
MSEEAGTKNTQSFMDDVRHGRLESGISMKGGRGLKEPQRFAIRAAVASCAVSTHGMETIPEIRTGLLERFEEMCRRQRIQIPAEMRPAILDTLLTELWVNQQALKMPADKLVPVTAYSGAIAPKLIHEFTPFRDTPSLFKHAAVSHSGDPREFLRRMQRDIAAMAGEEEFALFRDIPSVFKHAAVGYPSDPRGFLRGVQKDIAAMAGEEEFTTFRDTPSLFTRAAVGYPSDPREFLRRVQKDIAAMAGEEEFAPFRDTPGLFKRAAVGNPSDPRTWLRSEAKKLGHAERIELQRSAAQGESNQKG